MGEITFNQIPAGLRTPGYRIEFDNSLSGAVSNQFMAVMFAQRLSTGTKTAGSLDLVSNPNEAKLFYGEGSMAARMVETFKKANPNMELWCISLDDNAAGAAAIGKLAFTGPVSAAGTLHLLIAGDLVQVAAPKDITADAMATAVAAAINDNINLPVTAVVANGNEVDLTHKHKGETGNDIDVRLNYYRGQQIPTGLGLTITVMSGGSGNPTIAPAIAALGDNWFNWFVMPYTNEINLNLLDAELDSLWGPMRQKGGRAFAAYRGTLAATGAFGNTRNNPHVSVMATNIAPQPAYLWAAGNAAVASASLAIDPARPLQTLLLTGLLPPDAEDLWTETDRNVLLFDGIATYKVTSDNQAQIERQITTYQKNSQGLPDASYLDINTPETLERIRFEERSEIAQRFPRHKLADDTTRTGSSIVRPKDIRGVLLALYVRFENKGWVEDFEHYKNTLQVQRDGTDRTAVDVASQPNLVNQFRQYGEKMQFVL